MKIIVAILVMLNIVTFIVASRTYTKLRLDFISSELDRTEHEAKLYQAIKDLNYQVDVLSQR